jgi:monoamine oxidase
METAVAPFVRRFKLNSEESIGPLAESIASYSVAGWLEELARNGHRKTTREDPEIRELRATATMMRGFFVADPDELSLLTYVEQFNEGGNPARSTIFRLRGGNDQLPERIAKALRKRVRVESCVRRIVQTTNSVRVSIQSAGGRHDEIEAEYAIVTAPAPIAAEIDFEPALSDAQATALRRLKYGRATKTLLHFDSHPWRRGKRFRACGTDLDVGAVWDGSEDQRGRNAIVTLLAGGSASDGTQKLLATGGPEQLCREIRFFGMDGARLLGYRSVTWENDPWARGGYAFFDPSFPPSMRPFLRLPSNRVFFAGEHTSTRWQGYMNGAVESGLRAAEEIFAVSGLRYKNSVGSVS